MRAEYWAQSDIGQVRKINEDHFLLAPELGLAVVADGVGGHSRGEVASALACRVVREVVLRSYQEVECYRGEGRSRIALQSLMREAVQRASAEVFRAASTLPGARGMATTLDLTLVAHGELFVAHVGDSRVYRVRRGVLTQLTEDHTVGQDMVRRGELSPEEASSKVGYRSITRAVGSLPSVKVDTLVTPVQPGDRFLMCSDGLTRHLPDAELPGALSGPGQPAVDGAIRLVNSRGGRDNVTAVLLAFPEQGAPAQAPVSEAQLAELRKVAPFEAATSREILALRRHLVTRDVRPGTLLFREGEHGGEMFFVLEGEVALTRSGHLLTKVGEGQIFGEMSLLDQPVRSASALSTRETRFLVLSREGFEQLMRQDDAVAVRLLSGLVQKLSGVVRVQNRHYDPQD